MHGLHVSLPSSSWKVPAAHLTQAPMLTFGANVPGPQRVCCVLPAGA